MEGWVMDGWMNGAGLTECTPEPGGAEEGGRRAPFPAQDPRFWGAVGPREGGFSHNCLGQGSLSTLTWGLGPSPRSGVLTLLCDLQTNGTRPGTASSKLSPWDKSSHSAHRVDLSPV